MNISSCSHMFAPLEGLYQSGIQVTMQKNSFCKQATAANTQTLLASYKVAYRIARTKKPHTIAETLILPAAVDMVAVMFGEAEANKLHSIPLSDTTISRRICDMADDINTQLIEKVRDIFAIQLDEATDSHNDAHLICYIRFVDEKRLVRTYFFVKKFYWGPKLQTCSRY